VTVKVTCETWLAAAIQTDRSSGMTIKLLIAKCLIWSRHNLLH